MKRLCMFASLRPMWGFLCFWCVLFGVALAPCQRVQANPPSQGKKRHVLCASTQGGCDEEGDALRLALIIGHNRAGERAAALRYAETDARKVHDLLIQLAGYKARDIWLLLGQSAPVVERAMQSIQDYVLQQRKRFGRKKRILLFIYYSGHAQNGRLLLGESTLSFDRVKQFMRATLASLRLVILDACESGRILQGKGLKRRTEAFRFPFVRLAPSATGEVIITATGQKESAHEDLVLRGGIFTHYLLSGLRGAADRNNDGHVTLEEVYTYSYNRALARTIFSQRGPQRARFSKRLSGYGSLILTTLSQQRAWLSLHKELVGEFFVWGPQRDSLLAEVVKNKGREVLVALPPGRYVLQWRRKHGIYHQSILLKKGERFRLRHLGQKLAYWVQGEVRGGRSQGAWHSFEGQLLGPSVGLSYTGGFSGIDRGIWHQGPSLHVRIPLDGVGSGRMSLFFQFGTQHGGTTLDNGLHFRLHTFQLDLGVQWTLFARPHWWIGAGALLRGALLSQVVSPREQQGEQVFLSGSFGPAGILSIQLGFAVSWFVQMDLLAGARFLNLGGTWTARWDLNASLGLGMRF
ncbi:MAG: caspase family protein [Myxococcales bacterium]|nr:caspase family protein [Myxococcales bacterium]